MPEKRQVYLLDPQCLKPEVIAVAFAKTSRSPLSFREIAAELTDEKSAEFHERWVVGYGHASVAEHAVLHIAVENVSRLAVEVLESNRLASYTEKSSRYQTWNSDQFHVPDELRGHPLLDLYRDTCRLLFSTYQQCLPVIREVIAAQNPPEDGEAPGKWERRIRSEFIDVCRFLLPSASLANVGVTINARVLEHAVKKMLSHPLLEVRNLGEEIKSVARQEVPTLVKYADPSPFLVESRSGWAAAASRMPEAQLQPQDWCRLVWYDHQADDRILTSALFQQSGNDYAHVAEYVKSLSHEDKRTLASSFLVPSSRFEIPSRDLEQASYTFELTLDQGAYFELKRHRMMTQIPQPLTTRLGYAVPRAVLLAGFEHPYRQAMQAAHQAYLELHAFNPDVASYVVPNAFNRRVLLTFNLRAADHFCGLRSAANAHFSMRRAARRIAEQIRSATPLLGSLLRLPPGETWQQVEQRYFSQTC